METTECSRFSGNLGSTAAMLDTGAGAGLMVSIIPQSIFRLVMHHFQSRKTLKIVREATAICAEACDHADCLKGIYKNVSLIRDNYLKIFNLASRLPIISILRPWIEADLENWEDLAEDCQIGSDKDFRRLVCQVAEKI